MEKDIFKLEECGINVNLGIEYTGSREKYIRAIQHYFEAYDTNRTRVTQALDAMDMENYVITVHSLKSNSKMIGATELSSGFEVLEMAGRDGDIATVKAETPTILDYYDILIENLKRYCDYSDDPDAEIITADEARAIKDELLEALDEYDDELSARLVAKLFGYPFDDKYRTKLRNAKALIDDFMYDEAADIIREIAAAI